MTSGIAAHSPITFVTKSILPKSLQSQTRFWFRHYSLLSIFSTKSWKVVISVFEDKHCTMLVQSMVILCLIGQIWFISVMTNNLGGGQTWFIAPILFMTSDCRDGKHQHLSVWSHRRWFRARQRLTLTGVATATFQDFDVVRAMTLLNWIRQTLPNNPSTSLRSHHGSDLWFRHL